MGHTDAQQVLKQYFGYDSFRTGQEQLITGILSRNDCLGVMPTGAGKSMCFQIPALMFDGITLVISPLISLMKDQVNSLTQAGIKAAFINSSLTEKQTRLALDYAKNGAYKIVYVAPERLEAADFLNFAKSVDISMVVVDEAHCISHWGQDFRPSYLNIPTFIKDLRVRPVVTAFTATATPSVRDDIVSLLEQQNPIILVTGFDRQNLFFEVRKPENKFSALSAFLKDKKDKSGIVYCATRNTVEEVCSRLNENGFNALRYHAGLSDNERRDNQDDFLYDRARIMVATNAFGMGIDKSNVSFVVHYNMPKNIESYYQEAGRAGRDGEDAHCLLLYGAQDVRTNMYFIENNKDAVYPNPETEIMLKERDRRRLKAMTFYCHTNDCLRAYILKYFGETVGNFCDNCGSCNTNFESLDVTEDAQKIISCIVRAKERYGIKMIIDILRGSKSEKILRLSLDKLSTYNISNRSEKRLRDIINHLVLNKFLLITDDEYPVLKLGIGAGEVLRGNVSVEMKAVAEAEKESAASPAPTKAKSFNKELFDKLKALRYEIAGEQKVPAFVIFADSTLTDMCIKLPANAEELLEVSGVGLVKSERYGERFLKVISDFIQGNEPISDEDEATGTLDSAEIEISDDAVTVTIITDRINCVLLRHGIKKLTGAKINDWLVREDYLRLTTTETGKNFKIATSRGETLGITTEERVIRDENCFVNSFGREAQQLIADSLKDILLFCGN